MRPRRNLRPRLILFCYLFLCTRLARVFPINDRATVLLISEEITACLLCRVGWPNAYQKSIFTFLMMVPLPDGACAG